MTPEMEAAFQVGSGFSLGGLFLLISSLLAASLFGWAAWAIVGQYVVWARDERGSVLSLLTAVLLVCGAVTVIVTFL